MKGLFSFKIILIPVLFVLSSGAILFLGADSPGIKFAFDAFDSEETFQAFLGEIKVMGLAVFFSSCGILFKLVLDKLRGTPGKGLVRDLVSGVLITPLVLAGTFESLQAMHGFILPSLFCFQNGFFWVTLLRTDIS